MKWTPSTSRGLTVRCRCSGRVAGGRPLGWASKEATAQSKACASRSFPVSTTRPTCASGSSCRQRRMRTPVEHRASKTRMGAPSGTSQSCSSASANSITERVLAGAIAGLRKPGPMRLAGPLGRASGLGCSAGRWTSVAPSSQRLPGHPSGSCMMERGRPSFMVHAETIQGCQSVWLRCGLCSVALGIPSMRSSSQKTQWFVPNPVSSVTPLASWWM